MPMAYDQLQMLMLLLLKRLNDLYIQLHDDGLSTEDSTVVHPKHSSLLLH
jgi:hypothetical protein